MVIIKLKCILGFLPILEDLRLDNEAEKELGIIAYDLRRVVSEIYPFEKDESVFFDVGGWGKKILK